MKNLIVFTILLVGACACQGQDRSQLPYYKDFKDNGQKSVYYKIRKEIGKEKDNQAELFAKTQRLEQLLRDQFNKSQWKSPHERIDPTLAFKLGMCVGLINYKQFGVTQSQLFRSAEFFMKHAVNPKDFEFTRIFFLLQAWESPYTDLMEIYKRLNKLRPDDNAIQQCAIGIYQYSPIPENREYSRKIALEQLKKYPESGALFWRYASSWQMEAYKSLDKNAAKQAIVLFDEYMKKFGTQEDVKAVTIIKKNLNKVIDGTFKMTGG